MAIRWLFWSMVIIGWASFATDGAANGQDLFKSDDGSPGLDRWQVYSSLPLADASDVWKLEDGVLSCKGLPRGYLYTKTKYTNFVLSLEWRWTPDSKPGKGGVLFRQTGEDKIWPKCLEAQLNVGNEGDFVGLVGYEFTGPADRLSTMQHEQFGQLTFLSKAESLVKPPGQWNRMTIEARDATVTIQMNGKLVNTATECDVIAGPILLTAENDPIQFRNVLLKSLEK